MAEKRQEEPNSQRPPSVTSSSAESIINNKPAIEPVEALIIRFGDVTIEKNRCADDRIDSHRLMFQEIEMLNSTKSSAVKDRILRRLLHRVRPTPLHTYTPIRYTLDNTIGSQSQSRWRVIRLLISFICFFCFLSISISITYTDIATQSMEIFNRCRRRSGHGGN